MKEFRKDLLLKTKDGRCVGKPMREVSRELLLEAGHTPTTPLRALRKRCLDCCAFQSSEVEMCTAVDCPSWPFRMGTDPWRPNPVGAPLSATEFESTKDMPRKRGRPPKPKADVVAKPKRPRGRPRKSTN